MEIMEPPVNKPSVYVRLPEMRAEVISAVRALSDPEHQQRVWVERKYPRPGYFEDLTLNVNILDDAGVLDNPHAAIGYTLASEDEAQSMVRLGACLDAALSGTGRDAPDETILASPLWGKVVMAAHNALESLTRQK
ncbi:MULTISPECIES: hypothetical protein [unclassified Streptomyces]|uniref:SCO4402 family protein n=1 Tax=unclassified Streptomyces TaxID=2593676 RepID=UPI0033FF6401